MFGNSEIMHCGILHVMNHNHKHIENCLYVHDHNSRFVGMEGLGEIDKTQLPTRL